MTLAISLIPALPIAITIVVLASTCYLLWMYIRAKRSISSTAVPRNLDAETEALNADRLKFQQIFDTSLIAMSFYGPDGMLIDLNQKMRELCEFSEQGEKFFRNTCFFHLPGFDTDFDPENNDVFHVCQKMAYPEAGIVKYIEFKIRSIRDDNGNLVYYAFSAREITQEREMYLRQKEHDREMAKTNREIYRYEEELHYLLTNSNMFVWTSSIETRTISFTTKLSKTEFTITFDEYLDKLCLEEQEAARQFMQEYEQHDHNIYMVHHFRYTAIGKNPMWYIISGMPIHDEQGRFIGHFGVLRDVTHLMEVQERLKQKAQTAEDSSLKKSTFLANMTHEIRTPLNAIVGFSDLLQTIDEPDERKEFIRIIHNNCDMLLRIINDILEASSIDQANLSISPARVDFAQAFRETSETLAQRVENPQVQFISDNPYDTFFTVIDKGRMQQVITNFLTNAVKYTHQGHIKIGYTYRNDPETDSRQGIYMYCEDTGAGIPPEKQSSVFERFVKLNDFVQGTGLGLSICQSIAKRCDGQIGVISEGTGHGSTFWIWVPCEQEPLTGNTKQ